MSTPRPIDEMSEEFRNRWFSDEQFKGEFQRATEMLLPDVGDDGLMPKLVTIHITDFEPTVFGIDYHALMLDDFNDGERRRHYIRMLGERSAIEKRNTVMAIMASETWVSSNMYRKDGTRRYPMPADDPKRKESICVFAMSLDGRSAVAQCRVTRTLGGKFKTFGTLDTGYSFEPKSALSDFRPVLLEQFWRGFVSEKGAEFGF